MQNFRVIEEKQTSENEGEKCSITYCKNVTVNFFGVG